MEYLLDSLREKSSNPERNFSFLNDSQKIEFSSNYINKYGESHTRHISISDKRIQIIDNLDGSYKSAKLNWRLLPVSWNYVNVADRNSITFDLKSGIITGNYTISRGLESLIYNCEEEIVNIEIEMENHKKITTIINF